MTAYKALDRDTNYVVSILRPADELYFSLTLFLASTSDVYGTVSTIIT